MAEYSSTSKEYSPTQKELLNSHFTHLENALLRQAGTMSVNPLFGKQVQNNNGDKITVY